MRASGHTSRYAIWFQTGKMPPVYASQAERHGKGPSLRSPLILRLAHIQGGRCYLCGGMMRERSSPTRDHVLPRAHGGKDGGNVLAAHSVCNNKKADRMPFPCEVLYLEAVNERLAWSMRRGFARLQWAG